MTQIRTVPSEPHSNQRKDAEHAEERRELGLPKQVNRLVPGIRWPLCVALR